MDNNYNTIAEVSLGNVRPNMILAEDIIEKKGIVILAKNTMLNSVNLNKLIDNDIKKVKVWASSIDETVEVLTPTTNVLEEQMKPVKERVEYKAFEKQYKEDLTQVEHNFLAIGNGGEINVDDLYDMTSNIINKVYCKSDIFSYLGSLKDMNDATYSHCVNVSILCNLFSKWVGFSEEECKNITIAGLLHDIGKIKIDNKILNKKGKLTKEEFDYVKKHSYFGFKMIEQADIDQSIKDAVLMHHEKIDGSGYPLGLKGDRISKFAKIICICDVYDAMTSERVYRDKVCPFEVIRNFESSSFGIFDTECLLTFIQNIAYTYMGSWVKLTNGENAEVVFINRSQMSRPIVKCNNEFIDLAKTPSVDIDHII